MTWTRDILSALHDFYLFAHIDPGAAFVVLAVLLLIGRKVWRHFSKSTTYSLRDIRKYPGELLELGAIALLLIVGLFIKAAC